MIYKIKVEVFRFDAKSDFLPYFKKHTIKIEGNKRVLDLLEKIKEDDLLFDFSNQDNFALNINGKNLFSDILIEDIIKEFGLELNINPLSQKRAVKDLIIDTSDFYEKFDLIDAFVDSVDRARFEKFITYHYASDVYKYSDDFIGDALILFASEMLEKYPDQKSHILSIISNRENGIFLHTPICDKVFPSDTKAEAKINRLKETIINHKPSINSFVEDLKKEFA